MIRRPPRSTRTDTLFPYTTLFRSLKYDSYIAHSGNITTGPLKGPGEEVLKNWLESHRELWDSFHDDLISAYRLVSTEGAARPVSYDYGIAGDGASDRLSVNAKGTTHIARPEERRVGKECVSPCRSGWCPVH